MLTTASEEGHINSTLFSLQLYFLHLSEINYSSFQEDFSVHVKKLIHQLVPSTE